MDMNASKIEGGFRSKGVENKKSDLTGPIVSIITVVLNGGAMLEKTIQSVIGQTYSGIEYIIIDGGSADNTIDIIKKYQSRIAFWVSEKDKGIYDAMNKGINFAKGDIVYFLNCGDMIYSKNVLEKVIDVFKRDEGIGIVYGKSEHFLTRAGIKFIQGKQLSYSELWKGMSVCHQSMLYKKVLFDILGRYDTKLKLDADHEFLLRFIKERPRHLYKDTFIDLIISKYDISGSSGKELFTSLIEMEKVSDAYFGKSFFRKLHFRIQFIRYCLRYLLIKSGLWHIYCSIKFNYIKNVLQWLYSKDTH
jgi:glycosyltransferase involved in cell wall biosynthesis